MKVIPFPFPYAQIVQYLQLAFVLSCPFVVVAFVDELVFQLVFTFLGVFTFVSLNAVASQLEDPFGHDANDLPLRHLHQHFVCNLSELQESKLTAADLDCLSVDDEVSPETPAQTSAQPPSSPTSNITATSSPPATAKSSAPISHTTTASPPPGHATPSANSSSNKESIIRPPGVVVPVLNNPVPNGKVLHEDALRAAFNTLDIKGDGLLGYEELKLLWTQVGVSFSDEKKYTLMIRKVDPDGIGKASFEACWTWFVKKTRKHALKKKMKEAEAAEQSPEQSP